MDEKLITIQDVNDAVGGRGKQFLKEHNIKPVRDDGVGRKGGKKYSKILIQNALSVDVEKSQIINSIVVKRKKVKNKNKSSVNVDILYVNKRK